MAGGARASPSRAPYRPSDRGGATGVRDEGPHRHRGRARPGRPGVREPRSYLRPRRGDRGRARRVAARRGGRGRDSRPPPRSRRGSATAIRRSSNACEAICDTPAFRIGSRRSRRTAPGTLVRYWAIWPTTRRPSPAASTSFFCAQSGRRSWTGPCRRKRCSTSSRASAGEPDRRRGYFTDSRPRPGIGELSALG